MTMRRVEVAPGIELDIIDRGSGETGVAVLLHGFPESSHSWRHQVQPLVAAGWRVLVPDQRGYASSSAPSEISAYRGDVLADDVIALLNDIDADDAVIICRCEIDAERHTIADIDGAGTAHKAHILLQPDHRVVRHG